MMSDFEKLIDTLDEKNMSNKEDYKNVIGLSKRLRLQINQLKNNMSQHQNTILLDKNPTAIKIRDHSATTLISRNISLLSQKSPTETIMTYYDQTSIKEDVLSQDQIIQPLSNVYKYKSFDSAVELLPNSSSLLKISYQKPPLPSTATPLKPPLTPVKESYVLKKKPKPTDKPLPLPSIIQTSKKYESLFDYLKGIYMIQHILVFKTTISPYLFQAQDSQTKERKVVLKLIILMNHPNDISIQFPAASKRKRKKKKRDDQYRLLMVNDQLILNQIELFIKQQPLLPLIIHANYIFRDGYKIYIVYNHYF